MGTLSCTNCSIDTNGRLCESCYFWDHFYVQKDPAGDDDSCFFCQQFALKTGKEEIVYDKSTEEEDETENPQPDVENNPSGSDSRWTFYFNIRHPNSDMNIKLGDCVEIEEGNQVYRTQFLFRDTKGIPWFSGYQMIKVEEISNYVKKGRKRKSKDSELPISGDRVVLDSSESFIKLETVAKIVCGLPLADYEFGKPKGIKEENVFSCGYRYYPSSNSSSHFVIPDYRTCYSDLVWEKFVEEPRPPIVVTSSPSDISSPSILKRVETSSRKQARVSFSGDDLVHEFSGSDSD